MKLELTQGTLHGFPADVVKTITEAYSELAEKLSAATNIENWKLTVSRGFYGSDVEVRLVSKDPGSSVRIERLFDTDAKVLEHSLFTVDRSLQNKGLADIVGKTSVDVMDKLKWTRINVNANLDVGGYAWLRKGFFPKYSKGEAAEELLKYALTGNRDKLKAAIRGMSDAQVRKFVLSDDFKKFKSSFIGSQWSGDIDLSDEDQRAALLRRTAVRPEPAKPPRPARGKAVTGGLTDTTTRHQVMLERLKAAEAREFNKLIPILDAQVRDVMAKLDGPVKELTRAQLNGLLRELRAAQTAALTEAQDKLLTRLRNISAYESEFEASALTATTPRGISITAASAQAAWASATSVPLSATGDLLEPFVRDMTKREVDTINKVIMRGYSEGWTNDEITRVLRGTKKLNYNDGLMKSLGRHNATLVRTAVQHVSNQAREVTWEENDITEYRWVSTLDGRTTSQCRSLDGKTFTIGQGPRPPVHMNCRSTTVAIIPGLENLSEILTRASQDGQVKGSLSYYEWLKGQSAQFQDSVLGSVRGKLFRDGGLTADRFAQLQLNSVFEPLTLEEMKKLEPLAFRRAGIDDV